MKKDYYQQFKVVAKFSLFGFLCFLIAINFVVASNTTAQYKSVKEVYLKIGFEDAELHQVFKTIEAATDYHFTVHENNEFLNERISIEKQKMSVEDILLEISAQKQLGFQQVNNNIGVRRLEKFEENPSIKISVEAKPITGNVTDETGSSLPGATVLEKGTTNGTITDSDGNFQLNVSEGATILISFVGYESMEIVVGSQSEFNVKMDVDPEQLQEVVVVGYGTQSRRNVTGSVSKANMERTETLPNTNVSQALRGTIAGVQFTDNGRPGQGGNIYIRGLNSITASNNPLIVVDGVFFNGELADLNPNDIESVEVLKDASASAIYGSRAANGVILISTKRGKSGKPTIGFNTYFGVQEFSHEIQLLSPERYIQKFLDYRTQNGQPSDINDIETYLEALEAENYAAGETIDPWDVVKQDATIQSYEVNISANNGSSSYYLSANYTDEKGLIYGDRAKRISLRSNVDTWITKWLNIGIKSQFSQRDLSGVEANMSWAGYLSPYAELYFDGDKSDPIPYPQNDNLVIQPLFFALNNDNDEKYNNLFANFYAIVNLPVKGLTYRMNYSPNYRWRHNYNFSPIYDKGGYSRTGDASKFNGENFDWVVENILKYEGDFGKDHHLDVTLLYGANEFNYNATSASSSIFFTDVLGWNDLNIGSNQVTNSDAYKQSGVSSMARINYRFRDRYLLTLTARRDGTSVFGSQNKYGVFPSGAVAWIASEESFLKNVEWVNLLKLRVSYGLVGNQAVDPYSSLSQIQTQNYVYNDGAISANGIYLSTMSNSKLKWEKTKSTNYAIDFSMLGNRVNGTFEVYSMETEDLLLSRRLPVLTGFSSIISNIGATSNKGVELTLNTVNIKTGAFTWSTDFVFSRNKNKILHLYGTDSDEDGVEDDDIGNKWFIGEPLGAIYDYVQDGIYQEGDTDIPTGYQPGYVRLVDLNDDGVINNEDRTIVGQTEPKYRMGISNTFQYKGFSLSVFINSLQGWMKNNRFFLDPSVGFMSRSLNMADVGWWTAENKSTTRPSLVYNNPRNHGFYEKRDFVRIQDVSLSYTFNKDLLSKAKIGSARVYLSSKNLYTFTNWTGWDPESGYGSDQSGSSDRVGFPTPRSIVLGLNLSF